MFSKHEYDPTVKYIPASSGWYAHFLAAYPENRDETGNPDLWNRYFLKVYPVAMWAENKENHIEPYITDDLNPVAPVSSALTTYKNYTFIGVYHHDSYRTGDIPTSPHEYNPLEYLDSEYTKDGVSEEDLPEYLMERLDSWRTLVEEASEEKKKELFAERMKLEEKKADIDEELRLASLILDFNERGGVIGM
jgi:hypothetical protein